MFFTSWLSDEKVWCGERKVHGELLSCFFPHASTDVGLFVW